MLRKRIFRYAIGALTCLVLLCMIISWFIAGSLVASANRSVSLPPSDLPIDEFRIASDSSSSLAGWCITNEASKSVVVLLHPLRGSRSSMLGRASFLFENGFTVVLVDLQAHGESPGDNITLGHLEKHDVAASIKYVRTKFPDSKIGIVGWSLGGASALLASPLDVDAIVLESVYPTISQAVYNRVDIRLGYGKHTAAPLLLSQLPMRLGISTSDLRPIDFIDQTGCPVMVLAGDKDRHTPIDESRILFDAAIEPKQFVTFKNAAHEDLQKFDTELYREKVLGFFRENL